MDEHIAIDLKLAEEIREGIEREAPDMSDYLMTNELSRITHFSYGRINYSLRKGKKRPLYGFKRGDRWFIHRIDALQWAHDVATDQLSAWAKQQQRLSRELKHEKIRQGVEPPPIPEIRQDGRRRSSVYPPAPKGWRVYTYMEVATVLQTTMATVSIYVNKGGPLEDIEKFRNTDGRIVVSAKPVDDYARTRRDFDHEHPSRKADVPQIELVRKAS
jgi:hypothetical protein